MTHRAEHTVTRWRARWRAVGCTRIQEYIRRCEAGNAGRGWDWGSQITTNEESRQVMLPRGMGDWHVMSAARRSRRKITAERLVDAARNGQN